MINELVRRNSTANSRPQRIVSLSAAGDRGDNSCGFHGNLELEDPRGEPCAELLEYSDIREPAIACAHCHGSGGSDYGRRQFRQYRDGHKVWVYVIQEPCRECESVGYIGIDPDVPTICAPGTHGKVAVLAARYRAAEKNAGMSRTCGFDYNAPSGFNAFVPGDATGDTEVQYVGGE